MAEVFDIHQQWEDSFGGLLVGGQVFYGKPNTDPTILANQIKVSANRELSIPLPNPQTIGADGRVENKPWLGERYSIEVYDVNGVLNYTSPDNGSNPTPGGVNISLSNVIGINDLTAESPDGILEYVDQQKFTFEAVATNTDKMTLDIDGLGARDIKFNFVEEIKSGFIQNGQTVNVIYSAAEDNFSWTNAGRGISLLTDVAGSANAITANGGPSTAGYVDKQIYSFKAALTNLGNVTLKVGTLPTVSIKNQGVEIAAGHIVANSIYFVAYNSTGPVFALVSPVNLSSPEPIGNINPNTIKGTTGEFTTSIKAATGQTITAFDNSTLAASTTKVPTNTAVINHVTAKSANPGAVARNVVMVQKTNTQDSVFGANTFGLITSLAPTITINSGNSVLITVSAAISNRGDVSNNSCAIRLKRGSTIIGNAPAAGSRQLGIAVIGDQQAGGVLNGSFMFRDNNPGVGPHTYTIEAAASTHTGIFVNRTQADSNGITTIRNTSIMTLQEVR